MAEHPATRSPNILVRLWRLLASPSAYYSFGAILLYGLGLGIVLWGGFHWAIELSNSETFCLSCHEHSEYTQPEFQLSKHYSNVPGVRAECYDCHVSREWVYKVSTKLYFVNELIEHLAGTLSTREKYEAKRPAMAQAIWQRMRENDSRGCRNCHYYASMNLAQQEGLAARQHQLAAERGVTCIECHMGVAHKLPAVVPERKLLSETR
ncbi:MAG: NapC/NirT family cytochrome c [Alphaproteobacteria bacterium]|nr:NapC/NirT family cytochrome c [Alphaproteobacteria bacterium]